MRKREKLDSAEAGAPDRDPARERPAARSSGRLPTSPSWQRITLQVVFESPEIDHRAM